MTKNPYNYVPRNPQVCTTDFDEFITKFMEAKFIERFYIGRSTVKESIVVPIWPETSGDGAGLCCDQKLRCSGRLCAHDKFKDRQGRKKVAKKGGRDIDSIEERANRRFRVVHDPHQRSPRTNSEERY